MNKRLLTYAETKIWLDAFEITRVPEALVNSKQAAQAWAEAHGYPVVLKLISTQVTHKTDAQIVKLSIGSSNDLNIAWDHLLNRLPVEQIEGVLIQKMITSAVEVLVGTSFDNQFGHMLIFGSGGILTELLEDSAMVFLPTQAWQIRHMIEETRIYKLLHGYRGSAPVDIDSLVQLMMNISKMVETHADSLLSLDLNPVMVLPEGSFAVDARIFIRG
jgi:hypothetical protein